MATFEEKLIKLKQLHSKSHPDAKTAIRQWEDQFSHLQVQKAWIDHPNTIALRNLVIECIENIVSMLANKEDLSDIERRALFEVKKAHLVYLAVLTDDPTDELVALENKVDQEL